LPHYGTRFYSPKTLINWLGEYRRFGFDALKPGSRSDRGKSRTITPEMETKIKKRIEEFPRIRASVLYDTLVDEGVFSPCTVSLATFYRYLSANPKIKAMTGFKQDNKERKRFAYDKINVLWQSDVMYGPYLKQGKKKKQTYLIAFIDDASRLVTSSKFHFQQNFLALRSVLKDAVARRGVPSMLYTDNGKIYHSQQLASICARMGTSLIHTAPFDPKAKGKIERVFRTIRDRFLAKLNPQKLDTLTLDELNQLYWKWLDEDYQHKIHSGIKTSPIEFFMKQADKVEMIANPQVLNEYFLLREGRKVEKDGSISVHNLKYQVDNPLILAGKRVEIRFEPEWIGQAHYPLPLYIENKRVGEATLINFSANANAKRRRPGRKKHPEPENTASPLKPTPPKLNFSGIYETSPKGGEN
jgi:putative transposase